jgi:hypothetical protein
MVIFAVYTIMPRTSKEGIYLLRCIRSYVILDTYISMEAHTSKTLQDGRAELQNFANLIQVKILLHVNLNFY